MKNCLIINALIVAIGSTVAIAEQLPDLPSTLPTEMQVRGAPLENALTPLAPLLLEEFDIPIGQLLNIAQHPARDLATVSRSAKDAEIYRTIGPSVVEVST